MSVKKTLEDFGKRVVEKSKYNLLKEGKKDSGDLYDSIKHDVEEHKRSFHFSISIAPYGDYVDKGVQGKSSSLKAPNSPYKFGSGTGKQGGLTESIKGWTRRKRLQFRESKTGRFLSYESTSFIITRSIYQTGLRTTNFISDPFKEEFKKLPNEIIKAYGLEVNSFLKQAFK